MQEGYLDCCREGRSPRRGVFSGEREAVADEAIIVSDQLDGSRCRLLTESSEEGVFQVEGVGRGRNIVRNRSLLREWCVLLILRVLSWIRRLDGRRLQLLSWNWQLTDCRRDNRLGRRWVSRKRRGLRRLTSQLLREEADLLLHLCQLLGNRRQIDGDRLRRRRHVLLHPDVSYACARLTATVPP